MKKFKDYENNKKEPIIYIVLTNSIKLINFKTYTLANLFKF